jgi:hypothetical protein
MIDVLVNQIDTMTLMEKLHTICFTAFIVGGTLCCFVRSDKRSPVRPTTPSGPDKPKLAV